jgi:hypothetical protein
MSKSAVRITGFLDFVQRLVFWSVVDSVLEDYRLIVKTRFASRNDKKSYAGGSVISW